MKKLDEQIDEVRHRLFELSKEIARYNNFNEEIKTMPATRRKYKRKLTFEAKILNRLAKTF